MTSAVMLTTAAPAVQILWTAFLNSSMAILAVVGAVVRTEYKWGKILHTVNQSQHQGLFN